MAVTETQAAISVRAAAKTFEEGTRALEGVSFEIPRAQFVSVLGPSGCGKSTLLRMIGGLFTPDAGGEIDVLGRRQLTPSPDVGIVFQTHNMLPWLTVEENIRLAAEVRGVPPADIAVRTSKILDVLRLAPFCNSYPHQLSGGMRQRAAFGQILILRPQVLLLDEPFGALDALTRDQLNVELLRLWETEKQTVILITHSIAEAVFLSDRILVMSDRPGRIVADIRIDFPHPRDPQVTRALPGFTEHVLELNRMMGVI
jgi:NitT/TauT family transport system ATP-binding protein